jgi:hypothetical protein
MLNLSTVGGLVARQGQHDTVGAGGDVTVGGQPRVAHNGDFDLASRGSPSDALDMEVLACDGLHFLLLPATGGVGGDQSRSP